MRVKLDTMAVIAIIIAIAIWVLAIWAAIAAVVARI
jgi:hypothetical protein